MSMKLSGPESERGAAALFVALCLVLLLGMAAFAIDYGFGLNERRVDVAAADIGVMAGAVESLGTTADIRDQILSFTRLNLSTVYTNAEWQTLWQGCQDTELAGLNTSGYNFIPVAAPAGWVVQSPWCISTDPAGFVRVRLPNQIVETYFGRVLGVQELATNADAIARLAPRGGGGILPFGILATATDGTHVCLPRRNGTCPGTVRRPGRRQLRSPGSAAVRQSGPRYHAELQRRAETPNPGDKYSPRNRSSGRA